jgi:hypothetical protein
MGSAAVGEEHRVLADAFMIISIGSLCTRTLQGKSVDMASSKLVACLIDGASDAAERLLACA